MDRGGVHICIYVRVCTYLFMFNSLGLRRPYVCSGHFLRSRRRGGGAQVNRRNSLLIVSSKWRSAVL